MLTFKSGQRSSAEEQGTHKPLVAGSNPAAATDEGNFAGEFLKVDAFNINPSNGANSGAVGDLLIV